MKDGFPKYYPIQGDTIMVTEELHHSLNILAGRFYNVLGYIHLENHDYAASKHPMENNMYAMALEAAYMQQQSGELDN